MSLKRLKSTDKFTLGSQFYPLYRQESKNNGKFPNHWNCHFAGLTLDDGQKSYEVMKHLHQCFIPKNEAKVPYFWHDLGGRLTIWLAVEKSKSLNCDHTGLMMFSIYLGYSSQSY